MQETFKLARRHGHALSLMLLDIDHFKSYNDTFGHLAGDEVLKRVSALLSSRACETDLLARFGGEEFVAVLPETDGAGARAFAERVRAEMERSINLGQPVTVSVGVASLTDTMLGPAARHQGRLQTAPSRKVPQGMSPLHTWLRGGATYTEYCAARVRCGLIRHPAPWVM